MAAAFPQTGNRNAFLPHFFLMPNGELELFYAEGDGDVGINGWSLNVDTTTMKRRSGTWKVEGSKLVLGTWMSCDGLELNGDPALRCTLTSSIVTAAAQGRSGTWEKAFGMKSPDDSEWTEAAIARAIVCVCPHSSMRSSPPCRWVTPLRSSASSHRR